MHRTVREGDTHLMNTPQVSLINTLAILSSVCSQADEVITEHGLVPHYVSDMERLGKAALDAEDSGVKQDANVAFDEARALASQARTRVEAFNRTKIQWEALVPSARTEAPSLHGDELTERYY